jgi:hypothetical protein
LKSHARLCLPTHGGKSTTPASAKSVTLQLFSNVGYLPIDALLLVQPAHEKTVLLGTDPFANLDDP